MRLKQKEQGGWQECFRNADCWLTSISATARLEPAEQESLWECFRIAERWLTWISALIGLEPTQQQWDRIRGSRQACRSAGAVPSAFSPQSQRQFHWRPWSQKACRSAGECRALAHLDLSINATGADGAGRLAKVLVQCPALARFDLRHNGDRHNAIGAVGSAKLRASWLGLASDLLL
jgi:hypothetical protein